MKNDERRESRPAGEPILTAPLRMRFRFTAALLAGAALAAARAAAADQTITVGPGIAFSPTSVTVAPGEQVTWSWAAGSLPHTTTSDATSGPETWDSGVQTTGTYAHTFQTPGSYPFHCAIHSFAGGTAMNGTVIVAAATPTPTVTATPAGVPTATPSGAPTPTPGPGGAATIPAIGGGGRALLVLGLAAAALFVLTATRPR